MSRWPDTDETRSGVRGPLLTRAEPEASLETRELAELRRELVLAAAASQRVPGWIQIDERLLELVPELARFVQRR